MVMKLFCWLPNRNADIFFQNAKKKNKKNVVVAGKRICFQRGEGGTSLNSV